jgi:hypothetical protein
MQPDNRTGGNLLIGKGKILAAKRWRRDIKSNSQTDNLPAYPLLMQLLQPCKPWSITSLSHPFPPFFEDAAFYRKPFPAKVPVSDTIFFSAAA